MGSNWDAMPRQPPNLMELLSSSLYDEDGNRTYPKGLITLQYLASRGNKFPAVWEGSNIPEGPCLEWTPLLKPPPSWLLWDSLLWIFFSFTGFPFLVLFADSFSSVCPPRVPCGSPGSSSFCSLFLGDPILMYKFYHLSTGGFQTQTFSPLLFSRISTLIFYGTSPFGHLRTSNQGVNLDLSLSSVFSSNPPESPVKSSSKINLDSLFPPSSPFHCGWPSSPN